MTNDENDARLLLYTSKHLLLYSIPPPDNIICHILTVQPPPHKIQNIPLTQHTQSECTIYVGASTAFAATEVAGPEETFPPKNNNKTRRIDVSSS